MGAACSVQCAAPSQLFRQNEVVEFDSMHDDRGNPLEEQSDEVDVTFDEGADEDVTLLVESLSKELVLQEEMPEHALSRGSQNLEIPISNLEIVIPRN